MSKKADVTRIFIVEDHAIMREMIKEVIELEPDLRVAGSAADATAALEAITKAVPDLVLIDVALPGMSGIKLAELLRQRHPDLDLLMLSGHGEQTYVEQALRAGAQGYVLKTEADAVPEIIRKVRSGERYLSAALER